MKSYTGMAWFFSSQGNSNLHRLIFIGKHCPKQMFDLFTNKIPICSYFTLVFALIDSMHKQMFDLFTNKITICSYFTVVFALIDSMRW